LSRVSHFRLAAGAHVRSGEVHGYPIDLREKAESPVWPPDWHPYPGFHRFIAAGQWGLAASERLVAGEPGAWLEALVAVAEHLVASQIRSGERRGAWVEPEEYPHTFVMRGPWISAMAQGLCASVLVRAHLQTGRDDFADAARTALLPLAVPTADGGCQALLDDEPFPEEYPTTPPSYVLNGAIYAIWGVHDVGVGLRDDDARGQFERYADSLAAQIGRWDLGYWSRYDLYPHPLVSNVASASYHHLHITQLRALDAMAPRPQLAAAAAAFERYASRFADRLLATSHKVAFRLVVPRRASLAARLPWSRPAHDPYARPPVRASSSPRARR
jgi:heparosan-N-sulfate-glucuronate 5-epimerase